MPRKRLMSTLVIAACGILLTGGGAAALNAPGGPCGSRCGKISDDATVIYWQTAD
jgi:hypothetical protein